MEISEGLAQQQRLQAIAEKRERLVEIENRKRQLEDDRRQLQHLKSKALRERWLLDGAPSGTPEQDDAKKKLEEDEAKTKELEEAILRMEQELEELETGVKSSSTKDSLTETAQEEEDGHTVTVSKVSGSVKVVHEVNGENGVHLLSSTEVDELIHKADEISMVSEAVPSSIAPQVTAPEPEPEVPKVEITGIEAKSGKTSPEPATDSGIAEASSKNPVVMTFMGYQSVEDEGETRKVLGLQEGTVKAELVVIDDGEGKTASPTSATSVVGSEASVSVQISAKEEPTVAPPNGSTAASDPAKGEAMVPPPESAEAGEPEGNAAAEGNKEKQPCKCCTIM